MLLKNDLNRILIENAVRLNLKNFENDEKRCIRRLIDTGATVTKSSSDDGIFSKLRELFKDDNSPYYSAAASLFRNISRDRLICFGVNLGYNSFTKGAKTIAQFEKKSGKVVPWIADMDVTTENEAKYRSETFEKLLAHYSGFGINTYIMRFSNGIPEGTYLAIFETLEQNPYIDVLLMLPDEVLSNKIIMAMDKLNNIMAVISYDSENYNEMLDKLESMKIINASRFTVSNGFSEKLNEEKIFSKVSDCLCPVLILEYDKDISDEEKKAFKAGLSALRENPPAPLFIINLEDDIQAVNRSISGKDISTHINVKA